MRVLIFTVLLSVVNTSAALSYFLDGNDLHKLCQDYRDNAKTYSIGVADGIMFMFAAGTEKHHVGKICIPENVRSSQLVDVSCNFLVSNPQSRNKQAADLIQHAFNIAWPCK